MIRRSDLGADFFEMIPRQAIRTVSFPDGIPHNAIWDLVRTREGRFFLSLCGEGLVTVSGQFFEFLPAEGRLRFCFDLQKVCLVGSRAIPPSKIHSAMDEMPDGRLIMATHTTVPAPGHPVWMIDAYYDHTWEGFAGGNLLIYDPATDEVQNLGVPVPRESIYGGMYDARHHAYYMLGYLRGHLYRYDIERGVVKDLGQVSEYGSFRLSRGSDGNLYGSTRSGWLWKIDVDQGRVVDLNYRLPAPSDFRARRQFAFAATGPDGRLYISHRISDQLVALDVRSGRVEDLGCMDPMPVAENGPSCVSGLSWDDHGRLWYGIGRRVNAPGSHMHLIHWDVLKGEKPVSHGLLGTAERITASMSEMLHADGVLYMADTNHAGDPPCVRMLDLTELDRHAAGPREICQDPIAYCQLEDRQTAAPFPNAEERMRVLDQFNAGGSQVFSFWEENPFVIRAARVEVLQMWRHVPPEESCVQAIAWEDDEVLRGACGATSMRTFTMKDGQLLAWDSTPGWPSPSALPFPEAVLNGRLPARPGRQYLAKPACWAPWEDGTYLVGTRDGMLARVDPKKKTVMSLGPVCRQGPVRAISVDASKRRAFGTAGDVDDLGSVFYFDADVGLRELGRTFTGESSPWGLANSCVLSAIALSPSGHKLAIGSADRLGTVYVYHQPRIPGLSD